MRVHDIYLVKKQPPESFHKRATNKNFAILTEKYLCWKLIAVLKGFNFIKNRFIHRCFPVDTAEISRTVILNDICE